jgi:hypothetical protein
VPKKISELIGGCAVIAKLAIASNRYDLMDLFAFQLVARFLPEIS